MFSSKPHQQGMMDALPKIQAILIERFNTVAMMAAPPHGADAAR